MPNWFRFTLVAAVLVSSAVIGMRVYLEVAQRVTPVAAADTAADDHAGHHGHDDHGPEALEPLPEFTLNDQWGEPRAISDWAGRPLLINFWATWCAPCRREIPLLQALAAQEGDTGIQVIGIAVDRLDDVQVFIAENGMSYPNLVGQSDGMQVASLFGPAGEVLPFTVLTTSDGRILNIHVGEIESDELAVMVNLSRAVEAGELDPALASRRLATL